MMPTTLALMSVVTLRVSTNLASRTSTVSISRTASCVRPMMRSVSCIVASTVMRGAFTSCSSFHVACRSSSGSVISSKTTYPNRCRPPRPYCVSASGSPIHSCPAGLSAGLPADFVHATSAKVRRLPYDGSSSPPPSICTP